MMVGPQVTDAPKLVNRWWLAGAIGALVLLAGCTGCGGNPTGDATSVAPAPRIPAGAQTLTEVPPLLGQDTSCDPMASLRPLDPMPAPNRMPAGTTMAEIQDRGGLIAGVDQNTYLFGYRNPIDGKLSGFDIDIAREIARAIFGDPSRIEFRHIKAANRISALQNKEVDVVVNTFTINCERRKDIEFSSVYYQSEQKVLVGRDSSAKGLADLGGKRVCAEKGTTSIRRIANAAPKPVPWQVDNSSDCLMLLQLGWVDAISTDDTVLAGFAAQDPGTKVVGDSLGEEPYGIGVPKGKAGDKEDIADNEDMVRFINGVLERLRSDGTWTAIYQQNLSTVLGPLPVPPPARYKDKD